MSDPRTVYLLTAESRKRGGESQTRAYSDRDACLADFNEIAKNKRIYWELNALTVDDHRPWFFADEPEQTAFPAPGSAETAD